MAEPVTMDVEGGSTSSSKRKLVDTDDAEIELVDSKKPKMDLKEELKIKVMKAIANAHIAIHNKILPGVDEGHLNINIGEQIHNISFRAYGDLRETANQISGSIANKIKETSYKLIYKKENYTIEIEPIKKIVAEAFAAEGIPFVEHSKTDPDNWYGIANPIYLLLLGFELRRKEQTEGHARMQVINRDGGAVEFPVSQYGIEEIHYTLMEGSTFPSGLRALLTEFVGPLTALLSLIHGNCRYEEKWLVAVKRAFKIVPHIEEIIEVIKGKKADEVSSLVRELAYLALVARTRRATKLFPPPNMFAKYIACGNSCTPECTELHKSEVANMAFSGKGAYYFYKKSQLIEWVMSGNVSEEMASQITYHSIFGTYAEDFNLLATITDTKNWLTRSEIGDNMRNPNTVENSTKFSLPKVKCYSKLSSAKQTNLHGGSYSQVSSISCFSGMRVVTFTDDFFERFNNIRSSTDEFFERLRNIPSPTIYYSKSINVLRAALRAKSDACYNEVIRTRKNLEIDTVEWKDMESVTMDKDGNSIKFVYSGKPKFFFAP